MVLNHNNYKYTKNNWHILIIIALFVSTLWGGAYGNSYNNCEFLYSEIKKYNYKAQHARDKYEYQRYNFILNQYKNNFLMYCVDRRPYQEPFRNQQDQSGGYLGY